MAFFGTFRGKFFGSKPTSNPQFIITKWAFPQSDYGKVFQIEEMPRPKMTNILHDIKAYPAILDCKEGQTCDLLCSVSLKNENRKADKFYPAQVQLSIINHKVLSNA